MEFRRVPFRSSVKFSGVANPAFNEVGISSLSHNFLFPAGAVLVCAPPLLYRLAAAAGTGVLASASPTANPATAGWVADNSAIIRKVSCPAAPAVAVPHPVDFEIAIEKYSDTLPEFVSVIAEVDTVVAPRATDWNW